MATRRTWMPRLVECARRRGRGLLQRGHGISSGGHEIVTRDEVTMALGLLLEEAHETWLDGTWIYSIGRVPEMFQCWAERARALIAQLDEIED